MARQPEGKLAARVKQALEAEGALVYNIHGGDGFQEAGIPDLLVCWRGHFIGLELKRGSVTSKLQEWQIRRIRKAGGTAEVVTSVEDALAVLAKLERKR